jgi:small subunit ribosomal protein S13
MAETTQVKKRQIEEETEVLVRILGFDVPSTKKVYVGLTKIKGISWSVSNAVCVKLKIKNDKKIGELSKDDIKKIEDSVKQLDVLDFLMNRRFDLESGENRHLIGNELDMRKDFDIKRLMKIKSYKGVRHSLRGSGKRKLPVRGQRTRGNFRLPENKKTVGVKRKKR